MLKPAAPYEALQLALHVLGWRYYQVLFGPSQELFEMVAHEAVQVTQFRIAHLADVGVL
ncbi:MAG: hypothetical protein MUF54_18705 [Polyangiaceae bacterium]|nr:hypothetical protein [Polyangiaceae bacterium]